MELFNAIFETFWTFAGTVILVAIPCVFFAAACEGLGGLAIIKIGRIDKRIDKSMNKKGSE